MKALPSVRGSIPVLQPGPVTLTLGKAPALSKSLSAIELPLGHVFSDRYAFTIPVYQRRYSWEREHAAQLLDDLSDEAANGSSTPYFLGSIVLVKEDDNPPSEVVDGQQRLTTLTILLCCLRDLAEDDRRKHQLDNKIRRQAADLSGIPEHCRLTIGERDSKFFYDRIQTSNGISAMVSEFQSAPPSSWTDSRKSLFENSRHLHQQLAQLTDEERTKLARFLFQRCYLVVVTTDRQDTAYRIFSVLNDRGLDLSATDILKSEIVGDLPKEARLKYSDTWEGIEDELGRDRFRDLFAHMRMIRLRTKLRAKLQEDFKAKILNQLSGDRFVDEQLVPSSEIYKQILDSTVSDSHVDNPTVVNTYLRHLNRLDNFDWIPPAMAYLRSRQHNVSPLQFFRNLERLAFFLFVTRAYENQRINRYAEVLSDIENAGNHKEGGQGHLQLTPEEQAEFKERLSRDVYYRGSRVMRPLLLKLDSLLVEPHGGAVYDQRIITVEHVLPQTPPDGSEWRTWFTDEEREEWTHKLANLVLLSRRRNTAASNRAFKKKIDTYLMRDGQTPFLLTQSIRDESEWTPQVLERRQRELIERLSADWRLQGTEPHSEES